jgi:NAD(P)-dependent dehydrogenase (short-subunit alcohol dehydrogenase family)
MSPSAATPVWLITGCSTGFGRDLAELLLDRGHRAVVTARDAGRVADLVQRRPDNALALALDVTDSKAIAGAVSAAEERFGRIDILVNNAGYGYLAAVEEGEDEAIRAMFEANVFGLFALTRAVLPGMRARRSGHIINIASVGGLVGNPGSGYYAATKFAVVGASEALAKEVAPLGLKVTVIEPGPFRTDWAGRSLQQAKHRIADYDQTSGQRIRDVSGRSGQQPGDPRRAAEAILQVAESDQPPLHLVLGRPGLDMVRGKLAALQADLDAWETVTLGADYPPGS